MMNRKGFTLIEVVMVIAIIAILSLILIPNIFVLMDKNKSRSCTSLKDNIISAAKTYVVNNKYEMKFKCDAGNNIKTIKLRDLIDAGSLTEPVINPMTEEKLKLDNNKVTVTYDCDSKKFSYEYSGELGC